MIKFYDTCAILNLQESAFDEPFMVSSVTINELESIKTSFRKSEDVKYSARKIATLFDKYDNYRVALYTTDIDEILNGYSLPITNDNIIAATAYKVSQTEDVVFCTDDIVLRLVAQNIFKLSVEKPQKRCVEGYKGYRDITMTDDQMSILYENLNENRLGLLVNEYAIIKNSDGEIVDKIKWDGASNKPLKYKSINHDFIGKAKPINVHQELAFDLLQDQNSKIKVLTGRMGSGKTMLMVYNALQLIKSGKYKKILWLRNTVEVKDTKPIGYLPSSKGDKLLPYAMDLADHCGGVEGLNKLVSDGIVEIEHLGFVRGRNISDTIIIANEVENMTVEHIQLLIGRLCEDSMLWMDGDLGQVDAEVFRSNSGLKSSIENLKGQPLFAYVELQNTERSEMAKLAELLK